MGWKATGPFLGAVAIDGVDSSKQFPLGTIISGQHETYGAAEFIYLKGVSGCAAGLFVTYTIGFAAALATTSLTAPSPHALAMAEVDSTSEYGWFMIGGQGVATKAVTASFAAAANFAASAGILIAQATGRVVNAAHVVAVASAKSDVSSCIVIMNRPHGASDVS